MDARCGFDPRPDLFFFHNQFSPGISMLGFLFSPSKTHHMQKLFLLFPKGIYDRSHVEKVINKSYDTKKLNSEFGGKDIRLLNPNELVDAINDGTASGYWIAYINYINP